MDDPPPAQPAVAPESARPSTPFYRWRPTSRWRPGRTGTASQGTPVECAETGETGFCKTSNVGKERIAAELARHVGVSVPDLRLGTREGDTATVGVSLAFGKESMDLVMLRQRDQALYASAPVQQAIRAASGLLALHAWLRTDDLKDEHLVIAEEFNGVFRVAAIDFSYSMAWGAASDPVQAPDGPPALVQTVDPQRVLEAVERIEASDETVIRAVVDEVPDDALPAGQRSLIVEGLVQRRGQVRVAMQTRRWLP